MSFRLLAAVSGSLLALSGCIYDPTAEVPPASKPADFEWARYALIGGTSVWWNHLDEEVARVLDERVAENVTVVECDSGLSYYLTDEEFERELRNIRRTVRLARERGLRVIWYYPSLEVLTDNAERVPNTMYKDHPDWLQVSLDGRPNYFIGTKEFWVDEGTESAWLCPNGPYREYYLDRIRRIAATGVDGIWPDVPLFMDTAVPWTCACKHCEAKFREATRSAVNPDGLALPRKADWTDPVFRRWLHWRHETIDDFLRAIHAAAREVSPNIFIAVETFTMDYLDAMDKGLDGTWQRDIPGFTHVWEVDSVSNVRGMECALADDWVSKIAMFKFGRGVDHRSPTWAFSYGNKPLDAGLVMAEAFAAQINPYELKTPEMMSTVGSDFRRRWFGWAKERLSDLYGSTGAAEVAIVFSSASRDYLNDNTEGYGAFATTEVQCAPDPDWWATEPGDSARTKMHLGDYRGFVKILTYAHVPFDIVPAQALSAERLAKYKVLILPTVVAMSQKEVKAVRDFVSSGGTLLVTGPDPSAMDEYGNVLQDLALAQVLGFHAGEDVSARFNTHGAGRVFYAREEYGRAFFSEDQDPAAYDAVVRIVALAEANPIWTDAPPQVHFELYHSADGKEVLLHAVNFTGLRAPMVLNPVSFRVDLRLPRGTKAHAVSWSSPEEGREGGPLRFEERPLSRVRFDLDVSLYSLVKVSLAPGAEGLPPLNPVHATEPLLGAIQAGYEFVKREMRGADLPDPHNFGVFTNMRDWDWENSQYAYGHNVTSEHMGLMLLVSAMMGDRETFDGTMRYVREVMQSKANGTVNWAIDKKTRAPLIQQQWEGGPFLNANAPIDDFRIVRGLLLGHRVFGDEAALALASSIGAGLRYTSVTDVDTDEHLDFPEFPGGVIAYAWNWDETAGPDLDPPGRRSGEGYQDYMVLPVDYCDLAAIEALAALDPSWERVVEGCVNFLLQAEIGAPSAPSGLFYGSYLYEERRFSGDFEMRDAPQAEMVKTIQSLWTALHLARYGSGRAKGPSDAAKRLAALEAARRATAFFRAFLDSHGRIPEYLSYFGEDVPECAEGRPGPCLRDGDYLREGEPRIYALLTRLAVETGDDELAERLVHHYLLPAQFISPGDPHHGNIGRDVAGSGEAEAWNVLESLLAFLELTNREPL